MKTVYETDENELLMAVMESNLISFDLETTALHPCEGEIGVLIARSAGRTWLLRTIPAWFGDVLEDPDTLKLGFNLKFDLGWLFAKGHAKHARNIRDLYLEELLVSAQKKGKGVSHSLQSALLDRIGIRVEKAVDHSQVNWAGELTPEMTEYCLEDAEFLEPLADALYKLLKEQGQLRAAQIENDAVPAVAWMVVNGVGYDRPSWEAAIHEWDKRSLKAIKTLEAAFADIEPKVKNWNSFKQVSAAVFAKYGVTLLNFQKAYLKSMKAQVPELAYILIRKLMDKRLDCWGTDFLNEWTCHCGRFHPEWRQIGTDTWRFSCAKPNLQQMPHEPDFRRLFKARPGYVYVAVDYSQIEMVAEAIIYHDDVLLQMLVDGADTHTAVAAKVARIPESEVTKDQRKSGKIANFGLGFGAGAKKLCGIALAQYDVVMTEEEAKEIIATYFTMFPGLKAAREAAYKLFNCKYWCKRFNAEGEPMRCVHLPRFEYRRDLAGALRVLMGATLLPTTWLNTPVQGSAGHGIKCAFRRLGDVGLLDKLILQIHDELVFELPIETADDQAQLAATCMILGMKEVLGSDAPVRVDIEVDETWCNVWACACGEDENLRVRVERDPCHTCGGPFEASEAFKLSGRAYEDKETRKWRNPFDEALCYAVGGPVGGVRDCVPAGSGPGPWGVPASGHGDPAPDS